MASVRSVSQRTSVGNGPFVEAWLRVRKNSSEAKAEAVQEFLEPLEKHIEVAGIGHISEICDAEAPHTPRGCPFQAWSNGEYMRIKHSMLIASNRGTHYV